MEPEAILMRYEGETVTEKVRQSIQAHLNPKHPQPPDPPNSDSFRVLRELHAAFITNPQLILETPLLERGDLFDYERYRSSLPSSEVETWLQKTGVQKGHFPGSVLYDNRIFDYFDLSPHFKAILQHYPDRAGRGWVEGVVRGLKLVVEEDLLAEDLLKAALSLLDLHAPSFLPTDPTKIFFEYCYSESDKLGGEYMGVVRGIHYIKLEVAERLRSFGRETPVFQTVSNLVDGADRQPNVLALVHELIHQKVAEVFNENIYSHDQLVSDNEVASKSPWALIRGVGEKSIKRKPNLEGTLAEGVAVYMELYILNRMLSGAMDEETRRVLTQEKDIMLSEIESRRKRITKHYYHGYKMVEKIVARVGVEHLVEFLSRIDTRTCRTITDESELYNKAIDDPTLISQRS